MSVTGAAVGGKFSSWEDRVLRIKGLRKTYRGGVQALKGIDLEVPGGVFGLLGPNGAGKTTLMKILATLLEPDSGQVEFDGVDFISQRMAARRMLGYLPQEFGLYETLTTEQTAHVFRQAERRGERKGTLSLDRCDPRSSQSS